MILAKLLRGIVLSKVTTNSSELEPCFNYPFGHYQNSSTLAPTHPLHEPHTPVWNQNVTRLQVVPHPCISDVIIIPDRWSLSVTSIP